MDKKDLIESCLNQYLGEKENNKVYGRENSEAYTYAKGKLIGVLTAFELDMVESSSHISVQARNGIEILQFAKKRACTIYQIGQAQTHNIHPYFKG